MDNGSDLYAILGVPPDATDEQIRKAFRAAANHFHPDRNSSPGASIAFHNIQAANTVLSNSDQRQAYDTGRTENMLQVSAVLSRSYARPIPGPQVLYAMLTLLPPTNLAKAGGGTPVNLGLVLDQSTSMQGPRLNQVKTATSRIIDDLTENDIISVVSFADHAEVLIPATYPTDKRTLQATVSTMRATGATAMFQGLSSGLQEMLKTAQSRFINHMILITDGRTYGDEAECLQLAETARDNGISISAMGIGEDWHDDFLDQIARITGGTSTYIATAGQVSRFMEDRIRSLGTAFAERTQVVIAPAPGVSIASAYRNAPEAIELEWQNQPVSLGILDVVNPTSLVVQFGFTVPEETAEMYVGRIQLTADILGRNQHTEVAVADISVPVVDGPSAVQPPPELGEALGKLMLYQLQEKARHAMDNGNPEEARERLNVLATRLFEQGEDQLAKAAQAEAERVATTKVISDEGQKALRYGTRRLVLPDKEDGT